MALSWSLAAAVLSAMAAKRFTGSSMVVASETSIEDTWLPMAPLWSSVRTEIGTMPTRSLSGSSPRSSRYWRSAPAHRASTTSFTVPPSAFFPILTSSSETCVKAKRRCGVIDVFNDVRGALNGAGGGLTFGSLLRRRSVSIISAVRRAAFRADSGWRASELRAKPTSSISVGMRSGFQVSGSVTGVGSGWRSSRFTVSSAPDTPSMAAWCVLVTMAIMPCSRPSTTYISHSGRLRSSGRPMASSANSASSRSPPGAGRAARRMW